MGSSPYHRLGDDGRSVLSLDLVSGPGTVREARDAVAEFARRCQLRALQIDDIRLAVSEAVSNVVRHAYADHGHGPVSVLALLTDRSLVITIKDAGRGVHAPASAPGLGVGLKIIDQIASKAIIRERQSGGTAVQMRFDLHRHLSPHRHGVSRRGQVRSRPGDRPRRQLAR